MKLTEKDIVKRAEEIILGAERPELIMPIADFPSLLTITGDVCKKPTMPDIEKVIFNPPATIMFFEDKTKVVVKCMEGEEYNPEVGMAMCISKKVLGKKYHKTFRYFVKEWHEREFVIGEDCFEKLKRFGMW